MEKNVKKNVYMCVCVCIYIYIYTHTYIYIRLNYFAVHQKLTQHCKSTILQFKKKTMTIYGKEKRNYEYICSINYIHIKEQKVKDMERILKAVRVHLLCTRETP